MYLNIVVGFDKTEEARDALALASRVRAPEGVVTAVCVTPDPGLPFGSDWTDLIDASARETLARATADVDGADWLRLDAVSGASAPRALQEVAERVEADLLVVGSTHRGRVGRLLAGTTGQRLLNGASCAVAVASKGYREESRPPATVGVGYDGSAEATAALHVAVRLAEELGAMVKPICVVPTIETWVGEVGWYGDLTETEFAGYRGYELNRMLDKSPLPPDLRERVEIAEGPPGRALAQASEGVDLLVMGSRGYGPVMRVLLGGASAVVVREAACPVLVVPRVAGSDTAGLVARGGTAGEGR